MFYPPALVAVAASNIERYDWAAKVRDSIVQDAQPWMRMSDSDLWELMFGPAIRRSWMVWSNGFCPACKQPVPMYQWKVDALNVPWKMWCPHCGERFPKNDFHRYYRSGLDEHYLFDPARADRSLLYNEEHPDPNDPLHRFGVDDGGGYVEGENRWRFIGAYLIYGQWKQAIVAGILNLAAAFVVTGDISYARKAAILLDRVADLYPLHDFGKQGVMYEGPPRAGYVSTWHDACEETREMAIAWDQIRGAIVDDTALVRFLSEKAARYKLDNPKTSIRLIRQNIEDRILRHAIEHRERISSNYPRTEIAVATMLAILEWPVNRNQVMEIIESMIRTATEVDGVTGEKGLSGYSAYTISGLADFLALFARVEPDFLPNLFARHQNLRKTWRFHIDTWCGQQYYPTCGDAGAFAQRTTRYCGANFRRPASLNPSMYSFFWQLFEQTGDPAYVQVLFHENDRSLDGLPHDLFCANPTEFRNEVSNVLAEHGSSIDLGSINKQQWRLAILRSGRHEHWRAVWLDYDSGGRHAHCDGLNLGLYAKGLDLMPDFGYPPVHYGGWGSPRSVWYRMTAAHNTVCIDGQNQKEPYGEIVGGRTRLWVTSDSFRAIRVSAPELVSADAFPGPRQFERTIALVDIDETDLYVLDVFRVIGGKDHAKFIHSSFSTLATEGLRLTPAPDYGHNTQMRNFQRDATPSANWVATWQIIDRHGYLPKGTRVNLRYVDFSEHAEAWMCEAWVSASMFNSYEEAWIPRLMLRRTAEAAPVASTFAGVFEPYEDKPRIVSATRLPLLTADGRAQGASFVAVELTLDNDTQDLFISADVESPLVQTPFMANNEVLIQPDWNVRLKGEICWIRRAGGQFHRAIVGNARLFSLYGSTFDFGQVTQFAEFTTRDGRLERVH